MNLVEVVSFTMRIVPIIHEWEGWIYSWGRGPTRNTDVGGNTKSRHKDYCAVDAGFYSEENRDAAYLRCYNQGLHGYKKHFTDSETGKEIWGFHMQDTPGKAPS